MAFVSPPQVASVIIKLQEPLISSTNSLTQVAGVTALSGSQDCVETMRQAYQRRRDLALKILKEHKLYSYTPQGAFYLMIDVSSVSHDSFSVAKAILNEMKVAVAPGEAFGKDGAGLIRVSLVSSEEDIQEGTRRICNFLSCSHTY